MKKKSVEIVIRGCIIKVSPEMARELEEKERNMIRNEWNKNELAD